MYVCSQSFREIVTSVAMVTAFNGKGVLSPEGILYCCMCVHV